MSGHLKFLAGLASGLGLIVAAAALPTAAQAGEPSGGGCCKPKPPCCKPRGHDVKVPGVKIYPPQVHVTAPNINVNVKASATASAYASSSASAVNNNSVVFYGGGGGGGYSTPGVPSALALNVVGSAPAVQKIPFQASRTQIKSVVIRAVCIDDRLVPHAASQVFPGQDVADHYEGELYRCVAGSRLQITIADFNGKISFDGGSNLECRKGEALWHSRGEVTCRPQKPARDCNERSLLRRYGVGVKVLKMVRVETYTAYREEVVQGTAVSTGSIVLDGGVGGITF